MSGSTPLRRPFPPCCFRRCSRIGEPADEDPPTPAWRPRAPSIKVVAFTVVSVIVTSIVVSSLLDFNTQAAHGYFAEFTNASGLQPGDTVRIAGVEVGKVTAVTLDGSHANVEFSVDNSQHLTTHSDAAIYFENLLGQRFLGILPGTPGGKPSPPGKRHPDVADDTGARPDRGVRWVPASFLRSRPRSGERARCIDNPGFPGRIRNDRQPRAERQPHHQQPRRPSTGHRRASQQLVDSAQHRRSS